MQFFRAATVMACCLFLMAVPGRAAEPGQTVAVPWQSLEPGLELARVPVSFVPTVESGAHENTPVPGSISVTASVLRIDPTKFEFSLYMASEKALRAFGDIGNTENFVAAINAGMYQRDQRTSTGYLRGPGHINNGHVAANFGAFFMAGPKDGTLPPARLLDRYADDWQTAFTEYGLVMQNFRMTTSTGRVVWKQAERHHSVAAMGQDAEGRVLFILCAAPVPAMDFMTALIGMPLGLGTVMYLEGGSEAALYLNAGGIKSVEAGRHISGLWGGSAGLMLPNVLGVRRKAAP